MAASRILGTLDGKLCPVIARPDFSTATVPWAGFAFEHGVCRFEQPSRLSFPKPMVFVCTRGRGVARWICQGTPQTYHMKPASVCVASCDFEIRHDWQSNAWRTVALVLDTSKFRHVAPLEAAAMETSRMPLRCAEDKTIATLVTQMYSEARAGCPSGRLFGESLSLALLSYLATNYVERALTVDWRARLSPVQRQRVLEFIRENLDSDIAVSDLAACIAVSPAHFSRIFRAAFGTSPYRYVMAQRVAKAKILLEDSRTAIGEIAFDLGFQNHSHFTKVFHAMTGISPRQFRGGR